MLLPITEITAIRLIFPVSVLCRASCSSDLLFPYFCSYRVTRVKKNTLRFLGAFVRLLSVFYSSNLLAAGQCRPYYRHLCSWLCTHLTVYSYSLFLSFAGFFFTPALFVSCLLLCCPCQLVVVHAPEKRSLGWFPFLLS